MKCKIEIIHAKIEDWCREYKGERFHIARPHIAFWQDIYEKLGPLGIDEILKNFAKETEPEEQELLDMQAELF